ncbi:MAG: sulfatase-like hydrolase/transferase, partial [Lacipirellulaceae bacterium]
MMKHEINSLGILLKYSTLAWMLLLAISLPSTLLGETEPNVVLFFVDDMGWTDWQASATNPNGSPVYETPNLNALASAGVTFSNAYASAPVCSPTRASLMTGKSPAKTRITDWIGAGVSTGT